MWRLSYFSEIFFITEHSWPLSAWVDNRYLHHLCQFDSRLSGFIQESGKSSNRRLGTIRSLDKDLVSGYEFRSNSLRTTIELWKGPFWEIEEGPRVGLFVDTPNREWKFLSLSWSWTLTERWSPKLADILKASAVTNTQTDIKWHQSSQFLVFSPS